MSQAGTTKPNLVLITCEHGGNQIPPELDALVPQSRRNVLNTHAGLDIGALWIARKISESLGVKLIYSEISRLVVDLNRSARMYGSFYHNIKPFTQTLTAQELLGRYYWPYRMEVEEFLNQTLKSHESMLHLSIHSFTPKLKKEIRKAEIGILYDPHRPLEKEIAAKLKARLQVHAPPPIKFDGVESSKKHSWRIRLNYPYTGVSDGFTSYLRKRFSETQYAGIEIEFNQSWTAHEQKKILIYEAFMAALGDNLS